MHEHTFIRNIIEQIPNHEKVKAVTLEVGELAGIEADHLKEHLEEQTKWDVSTTKINSKVKCSCGYEGTARILERLHDLVIYDCPECSEIPTATEGKDIKVVSVVYS